MISEAAHHKINEEIEGLVELSDADRDLYLSRITNNDMADPSIKMLDDFPCGNCGIDVPERLMWE